MWGWVRAPSRGGAFDQWQRSSVSALSLLAAQAWLAAGPAVAQAQQEPSQNPQRLRQVTVETPRPRPPQQRRAPVRRTAPAQQSAQVAPAAPAAQPVGGDAPPPKAASEMTFTGAEIAARPVSRPAEALEGTPGLIITQHSGEGKANQYFLRGYNLDHGTDLAITVDGMPINMRTHGHGQGYADLNSLIPELISTVNVRKGPYYADEGDFSSVGALQVNLIDRLAKNVAQVTFGSFGYQRYLGIGSTPLGAGNLLYAGEIAGYNGPWTNPDDMRKLNGILRYSQGTAENGLSISGMAYSNRWNSTDQVPLRAINSGEIGLYGAIDPSDGGNASRYSLSGQWAQTDSTGAWRSNAYIVKSTLNLFNNFTYFLSDQTNGDQFHQLDDRLLMGERGAHLQVDGGQPAHRDHPWGPIPLRRHQGRADQHLATPVPVEHPHRPGQRRQHRDLCPKHRALDTLAADHRRLARRRLSGERHLALQSGKFRESQRERQQPKILDGPRTVRTHRVLRQRRLWLS
jgi:hypothetical protein